MSELSPEVTVQNKAIEYKYTVISVYVFQQSAYYRLAENTY